MQICGPTRNSFLSGRRPQRTQSWNFKNSFRDSRQGKDWVSFPQYFKGASSCRVACYCLHSCSSIRMTLAGLLVARKWVHDLGYRENLWAIRSIGTYLCPFRSFPLLVFVQFTRICRSIGTYPSLGATRGHITASLATRASITSAKHRNQTHPPQATARRTPD
jgi:hypothetical protein